MIELIQNTGIQFIEVALNITEDDNLSTEKSFAEEIVYDNNGKEEEGSILFPYKWNDEYIDFDSINAEAIDQYGNVIPDEIKSDFVKYINKEKIYKIRSREALDVYLGHWLPIPYFRTKNDKAQPFHTGPQNWCRMWIGEVDRNTQQKEKCTHKLILAFDTSTIMLEQQKYLQPTYSDASESGNTRFKCVTKERFFSAFYSRADIGSWLSNIYDLKDTRKKHYFRHYANYFVLLDILEKIGGFPEIALLSGERSIETSLVLDVGNSRTCGLIVETTSPLSNLSFDFTSSKKIQIRDLSLPYKLSDEPFEMQIAFAEEKFGNEASDFITDVFKYPSLVRTGKEAVRLTSIFESEDSQATMSSPKRYLWSHDKSNLPWIKVDKDGYIGYSKSENLKKSALFGISEYLNSDGTVKKEGLSATESSYSRASIMTFAFVEIIYQVISYINNHNFRKDMGNSSFRRVLKNIVITCPTAMTRKEQEYLKQSLDSAVMLVKKQYADLLHNDLKIYPAKNENSFDETQLYWKYDEATCSQITYLYSELVDKFNGKHNLFFKYKGKKRENTLYKNKESVTIASVDIGGGTTDLMICNYQANDNSNIPMINPTPLFWEGFNIAGDDIVKRIIEFIVIPSIEKSIKDKGGYRVEETLNYLFGANIGGQTATHRIYRRQFANQMATFCAYEAINHITNSNKNKKMTIQEIFVTYPKPKNNLIPYIENIIKTHCGLSDFNFFEVVIDFDIKRINYAIEDIVSPIINKLSSLIDIFDCDILLLSGKSSNIGVIRELFEKSLVLSPDKIINFGDYNFGDWYPFATFGKVKDPKTTVSVGALIAFLSSINRLDKFKIDLAPFANIQSTAEYLGILNDDLSRIQDSKIILEENSCEGTFKFFGAPMFIGMRQVPAEDWIATPLYIFGFKDDTTKESFTQEDFQYPLTVTVTRDEDSKEDLNMEDITIVDNNGNDVDAEVYFKLDFRTLQSGLEYWKDSGSFLVKNFRDD